MLFPMHVLSPTTTNPHLLFAFLLDIRALSALIFILLSIPKTEPTADDESPMDEPLQYAFTP
jgi:hypothetical protein